jgi:hypothetical protein
MTQYPLHVMYTLPNPYIRKMSTKYEANYAGDWDNLMTMLERGQITYMDSQSRLEHMVRDKFTNR